MPMSFLYWLLLILAILAVLFGSAYPFASWGFILVELVLIGLKIFGKPIQ